MSNTFKTEFDKFGPINYINSFLVEKGVRDAYLIQNFESTDIEVNKLIKNIQHSFPILKLYKQNNYFYLSRKQLTNDDVNSETKIASLLRFVCDVGFEDLDREIEITDYNVNVFINGSDDPISIITYVCQTDSTKDSAKLLVDDIREVIMHDINLKQIVSKVELKVNVTTPVMSLIPKLMDLKYKFNKNEMLEMDNIIFNIMNEISFNKIVNSIDYMNPIHRGVMLGYISDYQHNILQPLYPLQSSGYMEQIYKIEDKKSDLMMSFLSNTTK